MDSPPRRAAAGRLPDRIYWRRRAVVLVALVIVVAIIWAIVAAVRGRSTTATPATTTTSEAVSPSPTPSATDRPTAAPTTATPATTSAAASKSLVAPSSAAPPAECVGNLLSLAVTGPRTVPATAKADLEVTVTNSSQTACVLVFDARLVLKIVSGTDEVWSTADCAQWGPTGSQTVQPGAAITWKPTWDRHRSQKECKVVTTTLKDGTYVANAMYTGAATAQWVMYLTA